MNYSQNYRITIWDEFKGPLMFFALAVFVMVGLHNTFYTTLTVDKKKVNVSWGFKYVNAPVKIIHEDTQHMVASAPLRAARNEVVEVTKNQVVETNPVSQVADSKKEKNHNEYTVIDGDISVSAAEFYHPKLTQVLAGSAISGYLEVQDGEVKGLSVNINSDKVKDIGIQMISMGESQLQGNIFVYDIDGENYTGTIYPTSPTEYMVSFVNGPWNGARVKFTSGQSQDGIQDQGFQNGDSLNNQENYNDYNNVDDVNNVNDAAYASGSDSTLYDQESYTAPETEMVSREWASEAETN